MKHRGVSNLEDTITGVNFIQRENLGGGMDMVSIYSLWENYNVTG